MGENFCPDIRLAEQLHRKLVKVYTGTSILMLALVLTTVLITVFPQIVLWLPSTMRCMARAGVCMHTVWLSLFPYLLDSCICPGLSSDGFLWLTMLIIFLLGWPLEWTEIIVIFVPIFLPLLKPFQIDPLLFGVMIAVNL
jgi:TRAP-type mannitol/chloroaromatic compound transport system permease large subunit